jgi:Yip1 domain
MSLVDRAKSICLSPLTEWPVIAAEPETTQHLLSGYAVRLAAIPAVAGFIGGSIVGRTLPFVGRYRVPLATGVSTAALGLVLALAGAFVLSLVVNALAPTFGGRQDGMQALKLAVYSATPGWVAGALLVLPGLGVLAALAGLYGLYLLYLGLPRLMQAPQEKALQYTGVVIVCAIVIWIVAGSLVGVLVGVPASAGMGGL